MSSLEYFLFILMLVLSILNSCETVYYPYKSDPVEQEESFEELMERDSVDRKARAIAAVNQFLNDAPEDTVAAILIENASNCNIIIKISGQKNYTLPIPKNGKNFLVVPKGSYSLKGILNQLNFIGWVGKTIPNRNKI